MLEQLETIASQIGAHFAFGTSAELNVLADEHPEGFLLFHEGYFTADLKINPNRTKQYTHALSLLLFTPSLLSDKPEQKRSNRDILVPKMEQAYLLLCKLGTASTARVTMNLLLNRTDRNLDGLRLSLTLSTPATALC